MSAQKNSTFDTRILALIGVAIVINIVGSQINDLVRLPLFIDSIGTVLAGVLAGPLAGALTGLLTNLILGLLVSPVAAAFAPVAVVIGLAAGLLARSGGFKTWWQAALSGVIIAAALTIVAVPIRIYLFGGVSGSGPDFIVAYLASVGQSLLSSVASAVFATNVADKILTTLIVFGLAKQLPQRLTTGYHYLKYSRA